MFEDSTFGSTGRIRTRSRGWMTAAFLLSGSVLAVLILIPLIYPEALPPPMWTYLIEAPLQPTPQPKPVVRTAKEVFHGAPQMNERTLTAPGGDSA